MKFLMDGYVASLMKQKIRDKNKRKPSYEKGTVRAVCDENGKCHMIPIDSPLPKGWYNKRGSKLCLKS